MNDDPTKLSAGVSVRDFFAAAALPAIIAQYADSHKPNHPHEWGLSMRADKEKAAQIAYHFADAMMAERKGQPRP